MNVNLANKRPMRDVFLEKVFAALEAGENLFFLSADFGSPVLDKIRAKHSDRFINVGIAEQNLINVATGLALEGMTVYAYAIAPFITMRCFEQIRVNLAILSQLRPMNVNLIGLGAGFSYDVSGPTHHCLEDLSIMRTLPNFQVISPADWVTAEATFQYTLENGGPKYLRFDAKPQAGLYTSLSQAQLKTGFVELAQGQEVCLISTGYLTHKALEVTQRLKNEGVSIGHVDLIRVKGFDQAQMSETLARYKKVITLEEGFVGKGGLDAAISSLIHESTRHIRFKAMGLRDAYTFHIGSRDSLHARNGLDVESIAREAQAL